MDLAGTLLRLLVVIVASTCLTSCNYDDIPTVDDASDVRSLSTDTGAIKARRLSDKDIPSLGRFADGLASIRFGPGSGSYEAKITDEGLKALADIPWKQLRDLGLDECDSITDVGVKHLVRIKTLRVLSLEGCDNITDDGLDALAEMGWLEYLGLYEVKKLSHARVERLRRQLPNTSVSTEGYLKRPKPYSQVAGDSSNASQR